MFQRLVHDTAFTAATKLLEIVGLALPAEHQKDVFDEFYHVVRAAVEAYGIQDARERQRINPSRN